ncbi:hypothetical protein GGR42_000961 [Saonia flava]|uniref:DUF4386 domain-containing protein n=1 Tax=Saonia flava TaxID=523696 RepID=A0A846R0W3_9FLAO|nr:DUF4386 domain-containing protein [Saonia flava]NJB70499.1 hypothetical protein [Saonia flava]
MKSIKKTGRLAGLLYFIVVITGIFALLYVPSKIIVWDNPTTTYSNLLVHESLFRLGIVVSLVCYLFFLFVPLALYRLFAPVNKTMATLMVALAVSGVPIAFLNMANYYEIVSLIGNPEYLEIFGKTQIQNQILLKLNSHSNGYLIAQVFWGLWLFPLGYLIFKSGLIPKVLGVFLMIGSIMYFLDFVLKTMLPNYNDLTISSYILIPASIGEIGTCLWLLIMGARDR